jgi:hypothetical protein
MSGWCTGRSARSSPNISPADPLHVGVGTLSHRQWLGRRIGAVHHHGGVPGNWQRRLCSDLSDCGSGGMLRAQSVSHAGDSQDQYLETGDGKALSDRRPAHAAHICSKNGCQTSQVRVGHRRDRCNGAGRRRQPVIARSVEGTRGQWAFSMSLERSGNLRPSLEFELSFWCHHILDQSCGIPLGN